MSAPPRLSIHLGDYLKDTPPVSRTNWEHHGIYLVALFLAWNTPMCRLPDDDRWLSVRFGCSLSDVENHVRPVLEMYFVKDEGFLYQKRLSKEFDFSRKQSEKQAQNAKSRWDKDNSSCHGNATPMPKKSHGNAPPAPALSPVSKKKDTPPAGGGKPPKEMVVIPDWVPKDAWERFVQMRDRIRAPLTAGAVALTLREMTKLRDAGEDPGDVLDQSVQRSWRGVFHVKQTNGKTNDRAEKRPSNLDQHLSGIAALHSRFRAEDPGDGSGRCPED